ncbi:MAG TPA: hypothetical protein VII49_14355 [Rhizomicrobium sp.]
MGVDAPDFRAARVVLRRSMRAVALRAIDLGLMGAVVTAISAFDRRRGLYLRGRILTIRRRHDDHTDFWRAASLRYPSDRTFLRQGIHCALRAGRQAEAEAGMASLLAAPGLTAADSDFVLGLAFVHDRRGDRAGVRSLIRRFFKGLRSRPDRRIAALRLNGIIHTHFGRTADLDATATHERSHRRLARMIDRSVSQPAPRMLLQRVVKSEAMLAAKCPLVLFDTAVSRAQCIAFVRLVHARLAGGEPFSFVRIGDGEAACLPYEPYLSRLAGGDAMERERIWWGKTLSVAQRGRMSRLVSNAIWSADCIGIPTASRYLRELRPTANDWLDRNLTGRGLRAILYCVEHYEAFRGVGMPAPVFTSCHLHQDLERWEIYPELLAGKRDVVLVSCHPDLADFVQTRFGARVAASVILPPDRVSAPSLKHRADARSLPDILDRVAETLKHRSDGRLVLIGGGYLGKWLGDVARASGGIALDVGSVFDYWLGMATRSYLDLNPV